VRFNLIERTSASNEKANADESPGFSQSSFLKRVTKPDQLTPAVICNTLLLIRCGPHVACGIRLGIPEPPITLGVPFSAGDRAT